MTHEIRVTPEFEALFDAIRDKRIQGKIIGDIDGLQKHPEMQGKPLRGELLGCRSLRTLGQRWRVIYRVEEASDSTAKPVVWILGVGIRKEGDKNDVYEAMSKLVKNAPQLRRLLAGTGKLKISSRKKKKR